jgi:N12 class adenine-specific DNA methylase
MANSLDQKSKLYAIVCLHLSFEYKRVRLLRKFRNVRECLKMFENVRECCSKEMFDFNQDEANSKKKNQMCAKKKLYLLPTFYCVCSSRLTTVTSV